MRHSEKLVMLGARTTMMTWAIEKMGYSRCHVCEFIGLESETYRYAAAGLDCARVKRVLGRSRVKGGGFGYR